MSNSCNCGNCAQCIRFFPLPTGPAATLSFVVNAGETADVTDDSLGSATVGDGETVHFIFPAGTVGPVVTEGSAIIDLSNLGGGAGDNVVSITNIDLKPTGNPNEFTTEVTWVDENGDPQTTTDPTPITINVDNTPSDVCRGLAAFRTEEADFADNGAVVSLWDAGANITLGYFHLSLDPAQTGFGFDLIDPAEGETVDVYLVGPAADANGVVNTNNEISGQHFQVTRTNGELVTTHVENRLSTVPGDITQEFDFTAYNDLAVTASGSTDTAAFSAGPGLLPAVSSSIESAALQLDGTYLAPDGSTFAPADAAGLGWMDCTGITPGQRADIIDLINTEDLELFDDVNDISLPITLTGNFNNRARTRTYRWTGNTGAGNDNIVTILPSPDPSTERWWIINDSPNDTPLFLAPDPAIDTLVGPTTIPGGCKADIAYSADGLTAHVHLICNTTHVECVPFGPVSIGSMTDANLVEQIGSFTPNVSGDFPFYLQGQNTNTAPDEARLDIGTAAGLNDVFDGSTDPISTFDLRKEYTISLTAGTEYFLQVTAEAGSVFSDVGVFSECPAGVTLTGADLTEITELIENTEFNTPSKICLTPAGIPQGNGGIAAGEPNPRVADAFLMYTEEAAQTRFSNIAGGEAPNAVPVYFDGTNWHHCNNTINPSPAPGGWPTFVPVATDFLFASVTLGVIGAGSEFNGPLDAGSTGGIPHVENLAGLTSVQGNTYANGNPNTGEFYIEGEFVIGETKVANLQLNGLYELADGSTITVEEAIAAGWTACPDDIGGSATVDVTEIETIVRNTTGIPGANVVCETTAIEPLTAAAGTLANGTDFTVANAEIFDSAGDGDIRFDQGDGLLTLGFSAPVDLLVTPTDEGDVNNPIVWQDPQNGEVTEIVSDGSATYTPGTVDAALIVSGGNVLATLDNPAVRSSDDWGLVELTGVTSVTVQARDAEAMRFRARTTTTQNVCDLIAGLGGGGVAQGGAMTVISTN